jgi:glycosyltransferase involved in cell wall biosynthesis
MTISPKVSVIVPCFNQAKYLSEALESVITQTFNNWECIIINDGSTDDTEIIASKWSEQDNRIKYFSKPNGGLSSARNFGIKHSTGEFILPLDADDKIGPQYLELAVQEFARDSNIKVVYCRALLFGSENGEWQLPPYKYRQLLLANLIFCSAFFRRADFERVGGYDESLLYGAEDWNFWLSILDENDKVERLDSVQFYYRKKAVSMHTDLVRNMQKDIQTRVRVFNNHLDKYVNHFGDPISAYEKSVRTDEEMMILKQSRLYKIVQRVWRLRRRFR